MTVIPQPVFKLTAYDKLGEVMCVVGSWRAAYSFEENVEGDQLHTWSLHISNHGAANGVIVESGKTMVTRLDGLMVVEGPTVEDVRQEWLTQLGHARP